MEQHGHPERARRDPRPRIRMARRSRPRDSGPRGARCARTGEGAAPSIDEEPDVRGARKRAAGRTRLRRRPRLHDDRASTRCSRPPKPTPEARSLQKAASLEADARAWAILGTDELVEKYLAPAVEKAAAVLRKALPLPLGVDDDRSALHADGGRYGPTWAKLTLSRLVTLRARKSCTSTCSRADSSEGCRSGDTTPVVAFTHKAPWNLSSAVAPAYLGVRSVVLRYVGKLDAEPSCVLPATAREAGGA